MSNYFIQAHPDTCGTLSLPKGLICSVMLAGLAQQVQEPHSTLSLLRPQSVKLQETSQTFGQFSNALTGLYELSNLDFGKALSAFYSNLLARQESLGQEFEKVLYDNLWDLYVRE
jgi:hypothetical protein